MENSFRRQAEPSTPVAPSSINRSAATRMASGPTVPMSQGIGEYVALSRCRKPLIRGPWCSSRRRAVAPLTGVSRVRPGTLRAVVIGLALPQEVPWLTQAAIANQGSATTEHVFWCYGVSSR